MRGLEGGMKGEGGGISKACAVGKQMFIVHSPRTYLPTYLPTHYICTRTLFPTITKTHVLVH